MDKFWIIGHPLDFCLSTPVLNTLFDELLINKHFETHDIEPEKFNEVIEKLKSGELQGVVTTMPHKTPALDVADDLTEAAKEINAVNLLLNENGILKGYNTDWLGAVGAIKTVKEDLKGIKVLVMGAGGAARAAAYGLKKEGADVAIWNRTPDRAKEFAEKIGLEWVEDMREWKGHPTVIINATSMSYQQKQSTLVPFQLWETVEIALDAVYGKTSLFLEEAKAMQVKKILSGEVWYLHQALPMFELLTGKTAPAERVKQLTHENLPNKQMN